MSVYLTTEYGSYPLRLEQMDHYLDGRCRITAWFNELCLRENRSNQYVGITTVYAIEEPTIRKVIFNDPATIVFWEDGTKTVVKCKEGDTYSKETGLALCITKKVYGNKGNYNNLFRKWVGE